VPAAIASKSWLRRRRWPFSPTKQKNMKKRDTERLILANKLNANVPTQKKPTHKKRGACPPSTKAGWKIVFCDEFDDAIFDERNYFNPSGKWETAIGGKHGDELQHYTRFDKNFPSNCDKGGVNHLESGNSLKIITKWEPGNYEIWEWPGGIFTPKCEPFNYTSGWIQTAIKFLYGYFEIRCKIPNQGFVLWPAFWLWEGGGNEYREIDIFEFGACQSNQANYAGFNMHIARQLDNGHIEPGHDTYGGFNNHYPGHFIVPTNVSTNWHKYAVKWAPNSVIWYVDDVEVYKVIQHTPPLDMRLIANTAIASWCTPQNNGIAPSAFPFEFEIDYIRVYQDLNEEFIWQWGNGGNGQIAGWYMNQGDKFITGDFDQDGRDEILAVAQNGWSKLLKYDGTIWQGQWHNNGNGQIDGWNMNQGDKFIAGDFNQDGRDEILAIAQNGWSKLLRYDGTTWQGQWHNNGNGQVDGWNMNQGDKFIAGDFNQDGRDEILAIAQNGWSKLLRYDGTTWQGQWHNNGNKQIAGWFMNQGDKFIVGDFNKDGRDEILAIAQNGWSKLLRYDGTNWKDVWHNDGGKTIHLWHMKTTDLYIGADFNGDSKANLLAISANGWIHMIQMSSILQY
jgi:hypothetical protein